MPSGELRSASFGLNRCPCPCTESARLRCSSIRHLLNVCPPLSWLALGESKTGVASWNLSQLHAWWTAGLERLDRCLERKWGDERFSRWAIHARPLSFTARGRICQGEWQPRNTPGSRRRLRRHARVPSNRAGTERLRRIGSKFYISKCGYRHRLQPCASWQLSSVRVRRGRTNSRRRDVRCLTEESAG